MKCVWLVKGATGQYSDHREWVVAAHTTIEGAWQHAELAQACVAGASDWTIEKRDGFVNPHDGQCTIDYNGVFYSIEMVEVIND